MRPWRFRTREAVRKKPMRWFARRATARKWLRYDKWVSNVTASSLMESLRCRIVPSNLRSSCSSRMQVSQLCVSRVVSEVFEDFLAKLFDKKELQVSGEVSMAVMTESDIDLVFRDLSSDHLHKNSVSFKAPSSLKTLEIAETVTSCGYDDLVSAQLTRSKCILTFLSRENAVAISEHGVDIDGNFFEVSLVSEPHVEIKIFDAPIWVPDEQLNFSLLCLRTVLEAETCGMGLFARVQA